MKTVMIQDVDQFGFGSVMNYGCNRDAENNIRTNFELEGVFCYMEWQKAFDRVNWTK